MHSDVEINDESATWSQDTHFDNEELEASTDGWNYEPYINIKEEPIIAVNEIFLNDPELTQDEDICKLSQVFDDGNSIDSSNLLELKDDLRKLKISSLYSSIFGGLVNSACVWTQKECIEELLEHSIFRTIKDVEEYEEDYLINGEERTSFPSTSRNANLIGRTVATGEENGSLESFTKTQDDLKPFKCSICDFKTKLKKTLKRHYLIHSDTKLFQCSECSYETNYKNHLKSHGFTHTNLKPFKCSLCNFRTNHKASLKSHSMTHSECSDRKRKRGGSLLPSISGMDNSVPINGQIYENKDNESIKYQLYNTKSKVEENFKSFECHVCNFKTKFKKTLNRHHLIHSDTKLFKCSECGYETNYKSHLQSHLLTHTNLKPFKCSLCNFETNHKTSLRSHALTHKKAKLFQCSHCIYETSRKSDYRNHLIKHSDAKMFKCLDCNFETYYKKNLKIHLLKHSKFKLFKCSECNYETNRKDRLKTHSRTHSNVKRHKCSECSYECIQKVSFKTHLLTHTNKAETF